MNWKLNRGDVVLAIMIAILIVMCYYGIARGGEIKQYSRAELESLAEAAALKHGLPPLLVFILIERESSWRWWITGDDGRSIGLMQINASAHGLDPASLFDPAYNVEVGCAFLARLYSIFEGDWIRVLTAYNFGAKRVIEEDLYVGEIALRIWKQYKRGE